MIKPDHPMHHVRIDGTETDAYYLMSPIHGRRLRCLVSVVGGWEHVSVCALINRGRTRIPVWPEMCFVKDTFWSKEECVMQLHVPEKDYVNAHEHVLHLWRPIDVDIPQPDKI